MLAKFTFKNHKSFLQEQVFSLEAENDNSMMDNVSSVSTDILPQNAGILRTAAIFGSTASGKTNVLCALDYMKRVVLLSSSMVRIARQNEPFAFQYGAQDLDSHYEVEFIQDSIYYRYGFVIRKGEIVKEWLMRRTERLTPLFSRDEYSLKIMGLSRNSAKLLSPSPHTLFLTVASSLNLEINREVEAVISWFSGLDISFQPSQEDLQIFTRSPELLRKAGEVIAEAECGIDGISLIEDAGYVDLETAHKVWDADGHVVRMKKARLFQDRKLYSDGTVHLICSLARIFRSLEDGSTLFIDDFATRTNIFLAMRILGLYTDSAQNPKGAQLVITGEISHLVDKAFRRDQIHLTSRDRTSQSSLVRLSSIPGVRKNGNWEKRLLENSRAGQYSLA